MKILFQICYIWDIYQLFKWRFLVDSWINEYGVERVSLDWGCRFG